MMHSFSFIDKASVQGGRARQTDRAIYRSQPMRSRFVEIYGATPSFGTASIDSPRASRGTTASR